MALGDNAVAQFTNPSSGSPRTAASVRDNDNVLAAALTAHDAAADVHLSAGIVNVEAYRALGVSDTATVALAMAAAAGQTLVFEPGRTYTLTAEIPLVSGVTIIGNGATLAATTRIRSLLYGSSVSNIRISGLTFDMGMSSLATYTAQDYSDATFIASNFVMGVYLTSCGGLQVIEGCTFQNLYTTALQLYNNAGRLVVRDNRFLSAVQPQTVNAQHIQVATSSTDVLIQGNAFTNTAPASADYGVPAFYASGTTGSIQIVNNVADYCGRNNVGSHQLATFTCYGNSVNVTISDNVLRNNLYECIRFSTSHRGTIRGNKMDMASIAQTSANMILCAGTLSFGGVVGIEDLLIEGNTFIDDHDDTRIGIFVAAYDYSIPLRGVRIRDNDFTGVIRTVIRVGGPCSGVDITNNRSRCELGFILFEEDAGGQAITEDNSVLEAAGVYEDIRITDNHLVTTTASGGNPLSILWTKSPALASQIGRVEISRNVVVSTAGGSGAAIVTRGSSGNDIGSFVVKGNFIQNYSTGFDLQHGNTLELVGNHLRTVTTPITTSGFGEEIRRDNRWTQGLSSGRAVLSGGTITVTTSEVLAGDNILLTRVVTGGTVGHLSIGTITAGTSFVINSSSASDTSTIYWEIRH